MTQDRGGMVFFERLGGGVVKMTVHGKSILDGSRDAGVELILGCDDMEELEIDVHKAQRSR
jgi:hypothetical protein